MGVFTDVAAEGILLAGGGRAILLQIADPAVAAGVARHSDFANRPLDRFANTVTYAYAAVFGSEAERRAVVERVNRAHRPVHGAPSTVARSVGHGERVDARSAERDERAQPVGTASSEHVVSGGADPGSVDAEPTIVDVGPAIVGAEPGSVDVGPTIVDDGPSAVPYNAFDPQSQLWVAATLYQSAITVYEKVFGMLGERDAEEVYQRYAVLGTTLQVPPELWPATHGDFVGYWNRSVVRLQVSDDARRVASDLLHPRTAPLWLRALMPLVRLVTAGLLTPELRRAFVLPWSPRHQRRFDQIFDLAAVVYPRLPRRLRRLPRDRYLRALRRSLDSVPVTIPAP